jgi:hypothetical protein
MEISEMEEIVEMYEDIALSYSGYHYVCCLIYEMFLESVKYLQRWYRGRYWIRYMHRRLHRKKYKECICDIYHYGRSPPFQGIPLLQRGGHLYREALHDFSNLNIKRE